jgi:cation diffusion facilitator CzcD-associated flavoprotein CzcO/acetyl esterase/lipase
MAAGKESMKVDVIVVGAGFAGLYLLHRLRSLGFSAKGIESGDDVGGTWYCNRYPGARCDIESIDYSYSFDPELEAEWQWSEKYATQPEILRYLQHVADKYDLRRDIEFSTRVESAVWDSDASLWRIRTSQGRVVDCRFYVMATGCLSLPKTPDIAGFGRFCGEVYYTGKWPNHEVDFSGKRVAVIGVGSSGIQSIPIIAVQAAQLTVFQRTPNYSMPAHNGPLSPEKLAAFKQGRMEYREAAKRSHGGVAHTLSNVGALQVSEEERQARYEQAWGSGDLFAGPLAFNDLYFNPASNETICEFLRNKIRSIVRDPQTAEALCPRDYPFGTKRPCLDSGYYETFNLPHVRLVDLRQDPILSITETGIDTKNSSFLFDAIVFATGFDAFTGPIVAVDIRGRDDLTLAAKWTDGPQTYLGLMAHGFPNFFTITGPGSPSVISNMAVSIEQHVEWVADCLGYMRDRGLDSIEPTPKAEAGWVRHVNDFAEITLYPRANSWYMGANVPGKPRVLLPYVGGVGAYRAICEEIVSRGYLGFAFNGRDGRRCNDGVIRPLRPDVAHVLETMKALNVPPVDTMTVSDARAFAAAMAAKRPAGPAVGEVLEGLLPGAAGDLSYRLFRPAGSGPHGVVVYFHGGGWVLGSHASDDAFCRTICLQADAIVVSVGYRHAPEARFPAAVDDGFAAVRWIAANAVALGAEPGRLAVCGWSAGGNIAAVVCQIARDAGRPKIAGQALVTPVTDCDLTRDSYAANGEGYGLTTSLMRWFWNHYAHPDERAHPKASPLRAANLSNLPPAIVVTCEFDPLRDEGDAYAEALTAAAVRVRHVPCAGQIHMSLMAVGLIGSAARARSEVAAALREFLQAANVQVFSRRS